MFVKRDLVGKIAGFDGIFERTKTGENSKNTWLDSSSPPYLAQTISPVIPRACKFFLTAKNYMDYANICTLDL